VSWGLRPDLQLVGLVDPALLPNDYGLPCSSTGRWRSADSCAD